MCPQNFLDVGKGVQYLDMIDVDYYNMHFDREVKGKRVITNNVHVFRYILDYDL